MITKKKILSFSILFVFIVSLIVFLQFVSPEDIVEKIGVRNGYLLIFFVSLFGGFSAGGSVTFITLLITLAVGGLNPLYLGLVSGVSLAIGDTVMFYVGKKGRELVSGKWDARMNKLTNSIKNKPILRRFVPIGAYTYIGLSPFPNDLLLLFMATINYPLVKMVPIIILGDITFTLGILMLTSQTYSLF